MKKSTQVSQLALLLIIGGCNSADVSEPGNTEVNNLGAALNGVDGTWNPEGPTAILNGQGENLQSPAGNQMSGAIHAVLAHPTDPTRLIIGATNGGIWTTNDAPTVAPYIAPHWTFRSGHLFSQSVGALDMDPSAPDTVLAGFGGVSSLGRISGNLSGLAISPDFGETWNHVDVSPSSPRTPVGRDIWSVAIRGTTMVVGDRQPGFSPGLLFSANSGQDWNYPTLVGGAAFPGGPVLDIVGDPQQPTRLYAAVLQTGIFRSEDSGATWANATGPTTCPVAGQTTCLENLLAMSMTANALGQHSHAEMAVGQGGRIFVGTSWMNQPTYVGYSDDLGATWTNMDLPRLPASPSNTITAATNGATPIRFTTATPHGLPGGATTRIRVTGVQGNTNANGDFSVTIPRAFVSSVTNDANPMVVTTTTAHGLANGSSVRLEGVVGNTNANGTFTVNVVDNLNFAITACNTSPGCPVIGNAAYVSGGTVDDLNGLLVSACYTFPQCPVSGNAAYTSGGTLARYMGTNPRERILPGGQGAIHFSIAVDPTDPNQDVVYMGGDRQEFTSVTYNGGQNLIGANDYSGNLWRGDAGQAWSGTAPGAGIGPNGLIPSPNQWAHLTHDIGAPGIPASGGTQNGSAPHADSRDITFTANNDLIEVDDGGIFLRANPLSNAGDWYSINGDLQITELHSLALDPVNNQLIGGTQDVGNISQGGPVAQTPMSGDWPSFSLGDGADVAVDTTSYPGLSLRYFSSQDFGGARRCTFDATGASVDMTGAAAPSNSTGPNAGVPQAGFNCTFLARNLRCTAPGGCVIGGTNFPQDAAPGPWPFVTVVELNQTNQQRMILINTVSAYESLDRGDTIFQLRNAGGVAVAGTGDQVPVVAGHPLDANLLYIGTGTLWMRNAAKPTLDPAANQPPGGEIRGIALDPSNASVAYVATAQRVTWTNDYGATAFQNITGDLFDQRQSAPAGTIRTIAFVPGSTGPDLIYIGTNVGVFVTSTDNLGFWNQVEAGNGATQMPNTLVRSFVYDQPNDRLYVGTFGHGAFRIDDASERSLPPAMICDLPPVIVPADNSCLGQVAVGDLDNGSFDPEGVSLTLSVNGGANLALGGPHSVELSGTDGQYTESCFSDVYVEDQTPPTFVTTDLADVGTLACSFTDNDVTLIPPTAVDQCDTTPTVTGSVISSTNPQVAVPFPLDNTHTFNAPPGIYVIEWNATDDAGNEVPLVDRLTQTVTVGAGIRASQAISLRNEETSIEGAIANSGSGETLLEIRTHAGDIMSVGPVRMLRDSSAGVVYHQGTLQRIPDDPMNQETPEISGDVAGAVAIPAAIDLSGIVAPPLTTPNTINVNPNDGPVPLAPGSYSTINNNGTMVLQAGAYYIQSLSFNAQSRFVVDPDGGTVLYIQFANNFQGQFLEAVNGSLGPVTVIYFGTQLNIQSNFEGVILAPNATVQVGTASSQVLLVGVLQAMTIDVRNQARLTCSPDVPCADDVCGESIPDEPDQCEDGIFNGTESDIDCGGIDCGPCADGDTCLADADCESENCAAGLCEQPSCSDGIQNGTETGVDCGGSCAACPSVCNEQTYLATSMAATTGGVHPQGWNLWANGSLSQVHNFTAGPAIVRVSAVGQSALGVAAHMVVRVGGVLIQPTGGVNVAPGALNNYQFTFTAAGGPQTVQVSFDNDYYNPPFADRNLIVNSVTVDCP